MTQRTPPRPSPIRSSLDYNRTLAAPVRLVHAASSTARTAAAPLLSWAWEPRARQWRIPLLAGVVGTALLWPIDGPLGRAIRSIPMGGDPRRELEALQQFGGVSSLVLVGVLIATLDPTRARRLLDIGVAVVATSLATLAGKMLVGRPRPRLEAFYDAGATLGPTGMHPFGPEVGMRHAWELWAGIGSDLWSFPSSHTSGACALAACLVVLYARAKWLWISLACLVAFARVLFGAHFPSDVVMGGAIGTAIGTVVASRQLGVRLFASGRPAARRGPIIGTHHGRGG